MIASRVVSARGAEEDGGRVVGLVARTRGGDFSWNGPEVEADRWIMASRLAFRRSCGLTVVSYGLLQKMKRLRRKFTGIPCKNFRLTARFISSFAADGLAVRNVCMRLVINSSSLSSIF